jgi:lipopolysaccharide assembly protein A
MVAGLAQQDAATGLVLRSHPSYPARTGWSATPSSLTRTRRTGSSPIQVCDATVSSDLRSSPLALDEHAPVTPASSPTEADAPQPQPQPQPQPSLLAPPPDARERTRISAVWFGIVVAAAFLVLLLVFILQNTVPVKVSFFTAEGSVPLGVLLLFAAIGGVLVAAVSASLRILQIRRRLGASMAPTASSGPVVATEHASDQGADAPAQDQAGMNSGVESAA